MKLIVKEVLTPYEQDIRIREPEPTRAFWSTDEAGRHTTDKANLGDTVYYHLTMPRPLNGKPVDLTLIRDFGTFKRGNDDFNGETITRTETIQDDGRFTVKLELPESWEAMTTFKITWRARFGNHIIMRRAELEVKYVENRLFIKPSKHNREQPEFFSTNGKSLTFVQAYEDDMILYVDDNDTTNWDSVKRGLTTLGEVLKDELLPGAEDIGDALASLIKNRKIARVIRGAGRSYDAAYYIAELTKFAMNDGEGFIPIPPIGNIHLINLALALPLQDHINETEAVLEDAALRDLERAKTGGLQAVRGFTRQGSGNRNGGYYGFYLLEWVSEELVSRILAGEFKEIDKVGSANRNDRSEIKNSAILYREVKDPITGNYIAIIEAFFIDIEE
jgi:hypothetical protein